ncbi:hypothetical protein GW846_01245 [Candidatus Gracilibacteria bacterium]|nr:hypothetical protein [Candidatus Gracilibacteria bacterium]
MRNTIIFLVGLMFLLFVNIFAYIISEDYRFFLKKIKYQEEVVYDSGLIVDDTNRVKIIDSSASQVLNNSEIQSTGTGFNFLSELAGNNTVKKDLIPLSAEDIKFLERFKSFDLIELTTSSALYDITTEYPDPYYTYYSPELTVYIFPSKNYTEVKKILDVQTFELPFTINETNSFGISSLFINLKDTVDDGEVRILGETQSVTFGLKIKKDSYNTLKDIF